MNMAFEEYKKEYLDDIRINAQIESVLPDEYFLEDALDKLTAMGELTDPVIRPIQKRCRNNKIMAFDAYGFDASDKSFVLISNDFKDTADATLTRTELDTIRTRMLNFIQEAFDERLQEYFDLTDEMLPVGRNIARRMKKDYVDLDNDDSIDQIKLYIITNKTLSDKVTSLRCDDFLDKRVELNVWSIKRFYDLYQSGKDREPILIETDKYGIKGIPCIKAEMSGNLDYDAYLAIVPGYFLHSIYYDHGSRLLEGNVRAFLSNRGKINKGIRETIRKEPTKFFAYNNGIACTAAKITLSDDKRFITSMEDLQIINGGQTTASLTSAVIKDKLPLDNIFVPMKLTVVKNDDYDMMIQNISRYANSQNSVKNSDFFSNHPFHRVFEALSKKIPAPVSGDNVNNTFWYYERSRGKYDQEQFKITRKSEKEAFARRYPKSQLIKKEDLAKFFTCAELLRPDVVSKGGEKCMSFFAEYIDSQYQKTPEYFNDEFFKLAICYAILFKTTDKIVKNSDWYISASYIKPFIVPYTISKIIVNLPKGYCLDYDLIWRKQTLYPSLSCQIEKVAHATNEFIRNSVGSAREYCSKEETWKRYKEVSLSLDPQFVNDLISKEVMDERIQGEIKEKKLEKDVNWLVEIYNLGNSYWTDLLKEGMKRHILSPMETDLLNLAIAFTAGKKVPSEKQAKLIWKIRNKLDQAGVLI
jgi:AIPR protein